MDQQKFRELTQLLLQLQIFFVFLSLLQAIKTLKQLHTYQKTEKGICVVFIAQYCQYSPRFFLPPYAISMYTVDNPLAWI